MHDLPQNSLATIGRILACNAFADVAHSMLAPIAEVIGASSGVLLHVTKIQRRGDHIGEYVHFGRCPEAARTYVDQGIFKQTPLLSAAMSEIERADDPGQPQFSNFGLLPYGRGMDGYRDFQESYDIGSVLAIAIPIASPIDSAAMCIAFHRSRDEPPFGDIDYFRLKSLSQAMRASVANIANTQALALSSTFSDTLLHHELGLGLVLLDDDLCVRQVTRQGLLDLGLLMPDGGTAAGSAALSRLRIHLMESELRFPERGSIDCGGITVEIRPFIAPGGANRYLLITQRPWTREQVTRAAHDLGLSARETDVAKLICAGQSNSEIAKILAISFRTVENHLRSIYGKIGITSRTQLVGRLLLSH